jgi:hypothetical protein
MRLYRLLYLPFWIPTIGFVNPIHAVKQYIFSQGVVDIFGDDILSRHVVIVHLTVWAMHYKIVVYVFAS